MNIFKNYIRLWMLLIASIMSCAAIAQDDNYGIGDGFDPANPGNPGSNGWNAATGEVIIDDFTTGNLNNTITNKIGNSGSDAVTQIVVAGVINNTDFRVGNNYAKCTLVDFSRTAGISTVPSSAYSGNTHLCSIMLPTSITDIGSNAFKGCSALTAMTCYTLTPPKVGSNALNGVADGMIVYVPSEAVDRYQEADIWKNFTILPIQETVHSLTVNMPSDIDLGAFKNMTLELVNAKSGQSYRYIITDKVSYVFNNLIENTVYKAYVKNNLNNIFGETNEVSINDKDAEVTFTSLSIPQNVNLSILADGNDVTSQATVTWTDSIGNYLSQGPSLAGYAIGKKLNYTIALPQNVVMEYALPNTTQYVVADGGNNIVYTLTPLQKVVITGKVLDLTTKSAISGAVISASQTFGGKYSKTTNVKTDSKGQYSIEIFRVPTSLAIAASDHISQTMECDVMNVEEENFSVADVSLKSISGAVISLGFTYTKTPDNEGEDGSVESYYSDYNNVDYTIINKTKNRSIGQFNVQYPQIVLLEEVNENDVIELTASSRTSAFVPVKATATIDAEQRASATFNIVGLGKLKSSFTENGNASVVGSLYDAKGKLLKTYDYSGGSLTVSNLADGNYTLVTMGSSRLVNTIYDLSQLPQTGLIKDVDYVQSSVKVESGKLSVISIAEVPTLDESKLYYTGDNTSFTVNKSSIVAGNYLTLTGHLDFKSAYSTKVSNVNLIVDLPESCSFVENSVMVGNSTSSYTLEGNRVIIPMARYTDRVRFCIIPTLAGEYSPSALAQFNIDGETITQPIGSAHYTAKDLSIIVPSTVVKTTIPVSGTAIGDSDIDIYDGNVLIGQTRSLANGIWATTVELNKPYNLSKHDIYAKITTKQGIQLTTLSITSIYDKNAIQVSKVTMINTAHPSYSLELCDYVTEFDFLNPKSNIPAYWYWPNYPKFTFIVDFTNNDPTMVSDVVLYVHTDAQKIVELRPEYDKKTDKWIVCHDFYYDNLPANVSLDYVINTEILGDSNQAKDAIKKCDEAFAEDSSLRELLDEIKESNFSNEELLDNLFEYLEITKDHQAEIPNNISSFFDEILQSNNNSDVEINSGVIKINDKNGTVITAKNTTIDAENLTLDDLKEFYSVQLSDSSFFYLRSNGDMVDVVFDGRVFSFGSISATNAKYAPRTNVVSSDEFFTRWEQFRATLDCLEYLSKKDKIIAKVNDFLQLGLKTKKEQLFQCRKINLAYRVGDLTPQQLKELDIKKLIKYMSELPDEIETIKRCIFRLGALFKLIDIASVINDINKATESRRSWNEIIYNIESIDCWEMVDLSSKAKSYRQRSAFGYNANIAINVATCVGADKLLAFLAMATGALGSTASALSMATMMEICGVVSATVTDFVLIQGGYTEYKDMTWQHEIRMKIPVIKGKCNDDDNDNNDDNGGNGDGSGDSGNDDGSGGDGNDDGSGDSGNDDGSGGSGSDDGSDDGGAGSGSGQGGNVGGNSGNGNHNGISNGNSKGGSHPSGNSDVQNVKDPSGYVYEGVSSNRIEGVTATAYYKETVEDMYGDKHENIVKWDAIEYAQENPLFTDENGMYAWDVPNGLWQVKFEKEGYETTYSEWLPVPPPQLDINIAMKQNVQPTVKSARAFEDAVEMEFDKYMMPELLTSDNIRVMVGDNAVEGTVELLNEEVSYEGNEEKFASKVRFNAAAPFDATEVTLMVSNRVKSYAGIRMQDDFSQTFTIEPEIREIVCDSDATIYYGESGELTVQVLPAVASAGKTLKVKSSSAMILSTDVEELTLDNEGKASLKVGGELPGAAAITYTVDGYDISATTMVNVEQVQLIPDRPLASIASGSALLKGTQITLSCPTSSAEIYYTTDGSCPCDAGAKKYDGTPITISEGTTLKIMAVGKKGDESEIVTYTYTLRQTNMTVDIQEGWNWISHNQDEGLKAEALMVDGVNCIRDITSEIARDPQIGFVGHVGDIMPSEAVKVLAGSATSITLSGVMANPAATTVTLQKGWNWLGYPLSSNVTVSDALSNLQAEEGDCITSLGAGFAQYADGKWTGDFSVMTPGTGYLYKSVSGNTFQYDETKKAPAPVLNTKRQEASAPWSVEPRKYPNMMCITAQVVKAGVTCDAREYFLGAFVNGECRGVGKEIDGMIFLSVYGDKAEPVTFVIVDKQSGEEYSIAETFDFHADMYGNIREPLLLHVGTATGIMNISDDTTGREGIYNTLGQRVNRVSRNGIFIHNGKKVLIKVGSNNYNTNTYTIR